MSWQYLWWGRNPRTVTDENINIAREILIEAIEQWLLKIEM
jgi:hypothetical protein